MVECTDVGMEKKKKGDTFKLRYMFDFDFDVKDFVEKYRKEFILQLCKKFGVYYQIK